MKINNKALLLFTRQLARLISAGLPLLQALSILEQQTSGPLKKTIVELMASIQDGCNLSEALAAHPKIFNTLYVTITKAGEAGGILGVVLQRLADVQEKSQKIKSKISSLLVYPSIVLIVTSLIIGFLLAYVVPKFETTFAEMLPGKSLPFLTQLIISISRETTNDLLPSIAGFVLIISALKFFVTTERGKIFIDKLKLTLPLFGSLTQKSALALFARTQGTLIDNGVPILQALSIAQETSGNKIMSEVIGNIYRSLKEGDSMVTPMKATRLFPPLVTSMIAVGEETGQLSEMLLNVATIYENEVDEQITRLLSLIEPLLILFLSLIVGTIVIALFLPLITMMSEMGMDRF